MIRSIKFKAVYGDVQKDAELSQPHGDGGNGGWHFMVDYCYKGSLWKRGDVWVFYGNAEQELTFEDIQILGEIIEEESKANGWSNLFGFDHDNRLDNYFKTP